MKIDDEEILLLLIVLFGLYLAMNRCGCNIDSGFSVGGDIIKNFFYDNRHNDIYDKLTDEFEELKNDHGLDQVEDLIELINYPIRVRDRVGNDEVSEKIKTMINKLDQYEKKTLHTLIQESNPEHNLNKFEGQAE